jgi:hypothetical protein
VGDRHLNFYESWDNLPTPTGRRDAADRPVTDARRRAARRRGRPDRLHPVRRTRTAPQPYAGTWQDRSGRELPDGNPPGERFVLSSYGGSRHCAGQSVTFLAVAWPPGKAASSIDAGTVRQYVRDPDGAYRQVRFRSTFARGVPLPPDARATGYHHGPYALWVSPSDADRHVYVQGPDGVERWPRPTDPIYCA